MIIATLIPAHPNFEQMIMFSAVGFMVVLFVLIFLSLLTSVVGQFFVFADKAKSPKPSAKKSCENAPAPKADIPEAHAFAISAAVASVLPELQDEKAELLAVLSAAAAVALEEECRVVSIKLAAPDMAYARQGRMQIFASKNYTPTRFN